MPRYYTTANGYTVADLLHFGFDHIASADVLLQRNARHFDSAGYLAHLGFECFLKAWHLHAFQKFPAIHGLETLWTALQNQPGIQKLSRRSLATLRVLDSYSELRYPALHYPLEVGSDDRPRIVALERALVKRMPTALKEVIASLHWARKGGRVLMEKPIAGRSVAA